VLLNLLYLSILAMLSPWLVWRSWRTGRYRQNVAAKLLGRVTIIKSSAPVAWFHGVSVGEIHLLATLVATFRKRHPDWQIVVSSTTDTGLSEAQNRFADCAVIAWPFDFTWAVRTALARVQPSLIVLAEAEMWPNFVRIAHSQNIPVAVVNARLSPRSFGRYRRIAWLARRSLFRQVRAIAVQAEEYAERFAQLGVEVSKLTVTGSVKYDGASGERDTPKGRELRRLLAIEVTQTIWVAGSTHAPEEAIVIEAFCTLQPRFPDLRLILVPRHPDRFEHVAELLDRSGLTYQRRSRTVMPVSSPIVLLDSVGELGAAWGLADVGYVGGTLDGKRGGQSMIEPAGYGVPTVFGPHIWNFRDAAKRLVEVNGAVMVRDADEVAVAIGELLENATLRQTMGEAARTFVCNQQGATERTLDVLDRLIDAPT